jgi:hypothetical protein
MYVDQNAGQNHNRKRADQHTDNMGKLKYSGTIITHQSFVHEEIMIT